MGQIANSQSKLSVQRIAWGAQLKATGVHGTGGEEGFLSMALNNHFACQGPEGWHVFHKKPSTSHWRKADIERNVRSEQAPVWMGKHLLDLVATGQIRLCKNLPLPWEFAVSSVEARDKDSLSTTKKRKRIEESSKQQLEPDRLPSRLWQHLGVTRQALPAHARPGSKRAL